MLFRSSISWEIEDSTVATLDKTTTLTTEQVTITPLKTGETIINVSATIGEDLIKLSCDLKVVAPIHITDISLDNHSTTIKVGESFQLNATITPEDATNKGLTWSTSDASVATVDEHGKVTAIKEGKATITVTTKDGGFSTTCVVTVVSAAESGFQLSMPIIIAIAVGGAVVLVVFIIILAKSKKARKVVAKAAKKQVKKATKKSSSSKKKK